MNAQKIGLIGGTGIEGKGIALRLAMAGIEILIGSRSPEKAEETARELNNRLSRNLITGMDNRSLIEQANLLFLTVPFSHTESLLAEHRGAFHPDHILVDVTVPVVFQKGPRLLHLDHSSGAEQIRSQLPEEVAVVSAFKTMPAHLLSETEERLECDEFICSDSAEAKQTVLEVVEKVEGIRWIDAGPLRYSRALEAMTFLVIGINRRYKSKNGRFQLLGI